MTPKEHIVFGALFFFAFKETLIPGIKDAIDIFAFAVRIVINLTFHLIGTFALLAGVRWLVIKFPDLLNGLPEDLASVQQVAGSAWTWVKKRVHAGEVAMDCSGDGAGPAKRPRRNANQ